MNKGFYRFLPNFTGYRFHPGLSCAQKAKDTLLERDVSGGFAKMHNPGEVSNLGPERHGKVVEGGVPKTRRASASDSVARRLAMANWC